MPNLNTMLSLCHNPQEMLFFHIFKFLNLRERKSAMPLLKFLPHVLIETINLPLQILFI